MQGMKMTCPDCDGTGKVWYIVRDIGGDFRKELRRCDRCHGTGQVEEKKPTNFSRITASPDALADFICDISFYFPWDDSEFCCRYNIETEQDRINFVRDWLKQESDTE